MGGEPAIGKANQPFYFGEVPIVKSAVQATKQMIELAREPQLHDYVVLTSGSFFVTPLFEIGILPGTSFLIYALADSVADPLLAGVDGYFVNEIDYETYRRVIVNASNEADKKACALGEAVEQAYLNFFGIKLDELKPDDRIELEAEIPDNDGYDLDQGFVEIFNVNRCLPALCLERILAAAAMYQDMAKELKIEAYKITVSLHAKVENTKDEWTTSILYSYEAKKETNEDTVRATD